MSPPKTLRVVGARSTLVLAKTRHSRLLAGLCVVASVLLAALASGAAADVGAPFVGQRFLVVVAPRAHPGADQLAHPRVEIVGRDGRLLRLIAKPASTIGQAAFSPDRKMVAWEASSGIFVVSAKGSKPRLLVPGGMFVWSPVWSPDSSKLLFAPTGGGLATVTVATGEQHQIVSTHVTYSPLGWSRHSILYLASKRLWLAKPSGASPRPIYRPFSAVHDTPAPSLSPNGKWVALTTDGWDRRDPRLLIINTATGKRTRVRNFNGYTQSPVWAPNSTRFAVGDSQGPVQIISSSGRLLSSISQTGLAPTAWTRSGLYLIPGNEPPWPTQLFVTPNGQRVANVVFTLPNRQVLLSAQPF
jgi:hypothetical protein